MSGLSNQSLLNRINAVHTTNASLKSPPSFWYVERDNPNSVLLVAGQIFSKLMTTLVLVGVFILFYHLLEIYRTADRCHPARSEAEWNANGCRDIIGKTWQEYAWPNRY